MKREDKAKAGYVGVRPKRGRVDQLTDAGRRRLPAMPENMRPELEAAKERHKTRSASPGARVYTRKDGSWFIDAPHRDLDAWEVQICEAFGTRSHATMWTFLNHLAELCRNGRRLDPDTAQFRGGGRPDEYELNFILALIQAEKPDSPLQAAMLAQMVANHMMQMRIGADLLGLGGNFLPPERVMTFAKLTNAFANQTQAYQKLRGRSPKQKLEITYKRKVKVDVYHHSAERYPPGEGDRQNLEQPFEAIETTYVEKLPGTEGVSAREPEGCPALPGPDAAGVVVPMRRPEEPDPVPTPRRTRRRAEG